MTRTWPVPRIPGTYCRKPTFLQRQKSDIHPVVRRRLQVQRDDALAELAMIDHQLGELSDRRVQLLTQLEEMRDVLWPEVTNCKGRRPPALDRAPMPPAPAGARSAWGRGLRGLCLTILGRHGALSLPDLHALIHRYGYTVESRHPVKALADAMGLEVREGRAVRVERGVYDLAEEGRRSRFRSSPDPRGSGGGLGGLLPWSEAPIDGDIAADWYDVPPDPAGRTDPARWIPTGWPDPPPPSFETFGTESAQILSQSSENGGRGAEGEDGGDRWPGGGRPPPGG